jgi:hypothetical protein
MQNDFSKLLVEAIVEQIVEVTFGIDLFFAEKLVIFGAFLNFTLIFNLVQLEFAILVFVYNHHI